MHDYDDTTIIFNLFFSAIEEASTQSNHGEREIISNSQCASPPSHEWGNFVMSWINKIIHKKKIIFWGRERTHEICHVCFNKRNYVYEIPLFFRLLLLSLFWVINMTQIYAWGWERERYGRWCAWNWSSSCWMCKARLLY